MSRSEAFERLVENKQNQVFSSEANSKSIKKEGRWENVVIHDDRPAVECPPLDSDS